MKVAQLINGKPVIHILSPPQDVDQYVWIVGKLIWMQFIEGAAVNIYEDIFITDDRGVFRKSVELNRVRCAMIVSNQGNR